MRTTTPFLAIAMAASAALSVSVTLAATQDAAPNALLSRTAPDWVPVPATAEAAGPRLLPGPITALRAPDGLFHVVAAVNGQPIRFVVDTGASVMVLNAQDAALAGVRGGNEVASITTAGGTTTMPWASAGRVELAGHAVNDIRVTIAPSGSPSLIGLNVLARLSEVRMRDDRLTLN